MENHFVFECDSAANDCDRHLIIKDRHELDRELVAQIHAREDARQEARARAYTRSLARAHARIQAEARELAYEQTHAFNVFKRFSIRKRINKNKLDLFKYETNMRMMSTASLICEVLATHK